MHLDTHSKGAHGEDKDLQQSCLAVRGGRGQRDLRRTFGRLRRLSKPAYAEDIRVAEEAEEDRGLTAVLSVLELLQDKIDLLLEGQEIHFEDVEDLEEKLDEAQKGILDNIEEGSNALREKTDTIVSAANATKAAFYSLLEVVGVVSTLGLAVSLLSSLARNPQAQELARKKLARFFPPKKE